MSVHSKKSIIISTIFFLAALAGATYLYWYKSDGSQSIPEHLQGIGGDFVLQSANGPVSLEDYRGKVVMVFFGYTNCPDICPLTLTNWTAAFEILTERELEKVRGLFVSVDPARDTLEVLKNYTEYFHQNITGVTGTHEELTNITSLYRSEYHLENEGKGENYLVDHMSFVYVINKQGKVRDLLSHNSAPEDIVNTLRKII